VKPCAFGSAFGSAVLGVALGVAACRTDSARPEIPPVTTAAADAALPLGVVPASAHDASVATVPAADGGEAPGHVGAGPEPPAKAAFVDLPATIPATVCERLLVAIVRGKVTALGETLGAGDTLVVVHGDPFEAKGTGLAVTARIGVAPCPVRARPATEKTVVRASAAPELKFAGGKMAVHLDVGTKLSPDLYMGRLEGTAPVGEHTHPTSWEILAAVEASGTFVLEGTEAKLGPRHIVFVPPAAKHAWKPDPGPKLVAIQMYSPPGPEQRFVALAAAEKDAGAPAPSAAPAPKVDAGTK
jgi:mannose-6-phosphate isomerase-like protein (cupin superfamily)